MYLLYADESGTPGGADQEHFVLAGVSVYEQTPHWLSIELEKIAERFNPEDSRSVELHGAPMFSGKGMWRKIPKEDRVNAIKDALSLIDRKRHRLFAAVVRKGAVSPEDPVFYTFQQLITRFDHFLAREHLHYKNTQRGLVLFDKSSKEAPIQALAHDFKINGHEWGNLRNMAEVPAFIDSTATRMIQLADLVAWAIFRKYERQDSEFFDIIAKKFDFHGGVQHGFHEKV